ncbi:MAG: AAA family ATPase, partial [Planctomycetaceae bacterium]|nr:AAA family ATPase [Planctomycetaceae bacterium]
RAGIEMAPLVDLALGPCAQYLVIDSSAALVGESSALVQAAAGRIGFVPLDAAVPSNWLDEFNLAGETGVVGCAAQFVEVPPEFAGLAKRLLGRTWIVETLDDALRLFAQVAPGLQFVTRQGEVVAADGTISVGPRQGGTGLISRKSELRQLTADVASVQQQIEGQLGAVAAAAAEVAQVEQMLQTEIDAEQRLQAQLADVRMARRAADERHRQLSAQISAAEHDRRTAEQDEQASGEALVTARTQLTSVESDLAEHERELAGLKRQLDEVESERQILMRQATGTQVQGAKSEERLANLQAQLRQLEQDQEERNRAIADRREHLAESQRRAVQAQWSILAAESQLALLYLSKEEQLRQAGQALGRREGLRPERAALLLSAQNIRTGLRQTEEELHAEELAASEVRFERDTLAGRLREDYGIELADLEHHPTPDELQQRDQVDEEIADLRRRIASIGSVNLGALEELGELEQRYESLSTQFKDLSGAKRALEQIIQRINADSRRLLSESIETVRGHFQELFKKLFGGGHADVVLEEGVDILDCGIEIIARPPGKEPRSISLLSGGEKTLTCVALLLAIFRSRPSPFCVLDEVDAALDEANIQRFIGVLQEFLAWTQFIIVTHSKKTMTCAQTLYGVTMQESGVSKRVSVRFEDVSDNGEIRINPGAGADETAAA